MNQSPRDALNAVDAAVEAIEQFASTATALEFLRFLLWPLGMRCPHCGSDSYIEFSTRPVYKCGECKKQFTVKTGTIMQDSPLRVGMWASAIYLEQHFPGLSTVKTARLLGVSQKTSWTLRQKIREFLERAEQSHP